MLKLNNLKQKLLQSETVIGTFVKSTDPAVLEVICMSGLDFVILDNEHTAMSKETMVNLIRVTEIYDVPVIVKIWGRKPATS